MRVGDSSMGAEAGQFHTTRWTLVMAAAHNQSQTGRATLAALCEISRYRSVLLHARRGHSPHDAQDLTQEFLLRVRKSFAGYADLSVSGFRREQARRTTNGDKIAH